MSVWPCGYVVVAGRYMQKHDGGRIVVVACKSMEEVKWCHEGVVAAQ